MPVTLMEELGGGCAFWQVDSVLDELEWDEEDGGVKLEVLLAALSGHTSGHGHTPGHKPRVIIVGAGLSGLVSWAQPAFFLPPI
jgi:hypothetical protein